VGNLKELTFQTAKEASRLNLAFVGKRF